LAFWSFSDLKAVNTTKDNGKIIKDEKEIGNIFNSFFIENIINLRENIDRQW
jgi:hypothetical protein